MRSAILWPLLLQLCVAFPLDELIFGGDLAAEGQFLSQVYLKFQQVTNEWYWCGGTLITPRHILTAAHCTPNVMLGAKAVVGLNNLTDVLSATAQRKNVDSFVRHPNYDESVFQYYDIAVLTVNSDFKINKHTKLMKILNDDSDLLARPSATVSGFGTFKVNANGKFIKSQNLRYVEVDIANHEICRDAWYNITEGDLNINDSHVCAGSKGKGSGPSDSGGPLQVKVNGEWIQIGLVTGGPSTYPLVLDQDKLPGVYTRVSSYCSFIEETTDGEFKCSERI